MPVATIGRSPIAPTETAVERWLDFVETEGLLLKQKSTIKKGFPKQSPSLAPLDSPLYTRGPHYALINSALHPPIYCLKSKQARHKLFPAFAELVNFFLFRYRVSFISTFLLRYGNERRCNKSTIFFAYPDAPLPSGRRLSAPLGRLLFP